MGDSMDTMDDESSGTFDPNGSDEKMDTSIGVEKYQKENPFMKHLPYYKELQIETEASLEKIIINLAKTVVCQDFQLGVVIYTKSLRS
jgi:hypothetical protein